MKADNFYRLKVLAGVIAFLFAGGWLFFASKLGPWTHLYTFAIILIYSLAAFLPARAYNSHYRYPISAIYIAGVILVVVTASYKSITARYSIDHIGLVISNLHVIVLVFLLKLP